MNSFKWRRSRFFLAAACVYTLFVVGGIALAQTGGGYTIKWSSIDGGVATSDDNAVDSNPAAGYILRGTIGQPEGNLNLASGGVYTLQGGIVRLPAPVVIPPSGTTASPGRNYFIDPTLTLGWTNVTYALGYWVQVARDDKFTQLVINDDTLSAAQLSRIVSMPGNGTYYWHVRAKSKITPLTWGNWSKTESFVIAIP